MTANISLLMLVTFSLVVCHDCQPIMLIFAAGSMTIAGTMSGRVTTAF